MTPREFVQVLADGGMPFADTEPDYCPVHGWADPADSPYHHVACEAYAKHLQALGIVRD